MFKTYPYLKSMKIHSSPKSICLIKQKVIEILVQWSRAYRNISSLFINNLTKTCHIKIVYSQRLASSYDSRSMPSEFFRTLSGIKQPIDKDWSLTILSYHTIHTQ